MTATFRTKNQSLKLAAITTLDAERPMTLRQLYYRLVSSGDLANSQKEYKRLGSVMTRLREAREVPRSWIVDHVRSTLKPSSWSGLADFADTVRDSYRKDFWASMTDHIEVIVEKDAVAGTIQPITDEKDVRIRVCRGYVSVSFAGEISDLWEQIEKPIHVYYLGDFDPSGFDLERNLRERLERYCGRTCVYHREDANRHSFCWTRLAVLDTDFADFDLIRLPVKHSDRRSKAFIRHYGEDCAEVDALPPSELRRRVEEAIDSHIDVDRWNKLVEVEAMEQKQIDKWINGMNGRNRT